MFFKPTDSGSKNAWLYLLTIVCCFPYFRNMGKLPFWMDELQTLRIMQFDVPAAINDYLSAQLHPPLYFLSLKVFAWNYGFLDVLLSYCVFAKFFIIQHFSPLVDLREFVVRGLAWEYNQNFLAGLYSPYSEYALRFPSAIFMSLATVFGAHRLRQHLGLLAAGLFAVMMGLNTFAINLAQDAKPGALSALVCVLLFFEIFEVLAKPFAWRNYRKLLALELFCFLTGYYAAIFAAVVNLFLLLNLWSDAKGRKALLSLTVFPTLLLITVLYVARLEGLRFLGTLSWEQIPMVFVMTGVSLIKYPTILLIWAVIFCVWFWRRREHCDRVFATAVALALGTVLAAALLSLIRPIFTSRYIVFLTPLKLVAMTAAAFMIAGAVVQFIKSEVGRLAWRNTLAIVLVLIFSIPQMRTVEAERARLIDSASGDFPIDAAFQAMRRKASERPVVYALRHSRLIVTEYYDRKHRVLNLMVIPKGLAGDKISQYFEENVNRQNLKEIFYLQVRENDANEPLNVIREVKGYRQEVIFARHRLVVTRFFKVF